MAEIDLQAAFLKATGQQQEVVNDITSVNNSDNNIVNDISIASDNNIVDVNNNDKINLNGSYGKRKMRPIYLTDHENDKIKKIALDNGFYRMNNKTGQAEGNISQLLRAIADQIS